jgi:hypothetical protein
MKGENNSRISTKCAGAVYTLGLQLGLKFTVNDIVKSCNISRSTFIRYYKYLFQNRKALRPIFRKHKVPSLKKRKKSSDKKDDVSKDVESTSSAK